MDSLFKIDAATIRDACNGIIEIIKREREVKKLAYMQSIPNRIWLWVLRPYKDCTPSEILDVYNREVFCPSGYLNYDHPATHRLSTESAANRLLLAIKNSRECYLDSNDATMITGWRNEIEDKLK